MNKEERVEIELDIPQADLVRYLQFAKDRGITFNELVEEAVREKLLEEETQSESE